MPLPSGAFRTAFPVANRGAELRKFHLRTFLQRQEAAAVPFATSVRDFQLLLHAARACGRRTPRRRLVLLSVLCCCY